MATEAASDLDDSPNRESDKKLLASVKKEVSQNIPQKRDISPRQFDVQYKNKIKNKLEVRGKLYFHELNLLLEAYESYRYEARNKKTYDQIDKQHATAQEADLDGEMNLVTCRKYCETKMTDAAKVLDTPSYELFQNFLTLFNVAAIIYLQELEDHPISLMQNWMIL